MSQAASRGITLVELAAVMAVMAILLSIGAGAYMRAQQGLREDAALGGLANAVREARQLALMNESVAWLEIDLKARRTQPVGLRTVAYFHLEGGESTGAFGYPVALEGDGAEYASDGHIGGCVRLAASDAAISSALWRVRVSTICSLASSRGISRSCFRSSTLSMWNP